MAVLDPRLRLLREERGVGPRDLTRTTHRGIEETQQVLWRAWSRPAWR
jgi:hypothetical protein